MKVRRHKGAGHLPAVSKSKRGRRTTAIITNTDPPGVVIGAAETVVGYPGLTATFVPIGRGDEWKQKGKAKKVKEKPGPRRLIGLEAPAGSKRVEYRKACKCSGSSASGPYLLSSGSGVTLRLEWVALACGACGAAWTRYEGS